MLPAFINVNQPKGHSPLFLGDIILHPISTRIDEALTDYRDPQQTGRERSGEFVCFCGGLFMMRRNVYADLGGSDERFIGWGGEDDAMTIKLRRLVASPRTLTQSSAFHLWHERSHESRYQHRHDQQYVALLQKNAAGNVGALQAHCTTDRVTIGY
ncbi:MAG: hypothetical protein KDB03_21730 [Planctomycetales bacterium]|nr:hypothetical protein [Planctomycetales bacterium]